MDNKDLAILKLPHQLVLHPRNSPLFKSLPPNDGWVRLVLTVMHELSDGPSSKWYPYVGILPRLSECHMPAFWSESQLAELEGCSMLDFYSMKEVKQQYERSVAPYVKEHAADFTPESSSFETYQRIMASIMSRAFMGQFGASSPLSAATDASSSSTISTTQSTNNVEPYLLPIIDMLNCSPSPNAELVYHDNGDITVRIIRGRCVNAGEQLFISYGDELRNSAMLARYGFVTPLGATPSTSAAMDNVSIAVPLAVNICESMCGKIKIKSMVNYAEELDDEYFYLGPLQSTTAKTLTIPAELRRLICAYLGYPDTTTHSSTSSSSTPAAAAKKKSTRTVGPSAAEQEADIAQVMFMLLSTRLAQYPSPDENYTDEQLYATTTAALAASTGTDEQSTILYRRQCALRVRIAEKSILESHLRVVRSILGVGLPDKKASKSSAAAAAPKETAAERAQKAKLLAMLLAAGGDDDDDDFEGDPQLLAYGDADDSDHNTDDDDEAAQKSAKKKSTKTPSPPPRSGGKGTKRKQSSSSSSSSAAAAAASAATTPADERAPAKTAKQAK